MKLGRKFGGGRLCYDTLGQIVEVGDLIAYKHPYSHTAISVARVVTIGKNASHPTVETDHGSTKIVRTIFVKTFDQTVTQ